MSIIRLKTHNGNYLSLAATVEGEGIANKLMVGFSNRPTLFILEERGKDQIALREAVVGWYLSAEEGGGGRLVVQSERSPWETFNRITQNDEKQEIALRAPDGKHFVSAADGGDEAVLANATAIGPTEVFAVEKVGDLQAMLAEDPKYHHCCGALPTFAGAENVGPVWNDNAHQLVVGKAVDLLRRYKDRDDVAQLLGIWGRIPPGRDGNLPKEAGQVYQGLRDADYQDKYTDPVVGDFPITRTYKTHFYDAVSRRNYVDPKDPVTAALYAALYALGYRDIEKTTALTEGQRYFNLALHLGRRIVRLRERATTGLYERAGYYLGLSLHFLTDLTQPMHALNFSALHDSVWVNGRLERFWWPLFHPRFEGFADPIASTYVEKAECSEADITNLGSRYRSAGEMIHTLANYSRPLLLRLPSCPDPLRCPALTEEGAKDYLTASLQQAPRWTAQFLMYWAHCIKQPLNIDPKYWYRILEPTNNEWVCLKDGHFRRWNDTGGNSLFYFLFNADGTCSLACKDWKANPWFVYKASNNIYYIGEYKNARGAPDQWARFRIVPAPNGKVWIFEPSADEVVGVGSNGYLVRWNPCDEATQLFTLQSVGPISDQDQQEIKSIWPHYGELPWWGKE